MAVLLGYLESFNLKTLLIVCFNEASLIQPLKQMGDHTSSYKKVILREHKRHTTCHIASTCCGGWGVPTLVRVRGVPTLARGEGYLPWWGVPTCWLEGRYPPQLEGRYPPISWNVGSLPSTGGSTPPKVPPPSKAEQTHACENITSRHPSGAGGKNRGF